MGYCIAKGVSERCIVRLLLTTGLCVSLAQWMNEFLVVEFCVFSTKVNYVLTLGVTMENLSLR